jgi:hypothetical protein
VCVCVWPAHLSLSFASGDGLFAEPHQDQLDGRICEVTGCRDETG